MRTQPVSFDDHRPAIDVSLNKPAGVARRIGTRVLHEAREAVPPTLFFFVGFNFIVFTTNLLLADYAIAVSNFMLATVAALVVGKAVLVANAMPYLRRYDRAPLIQPILYKTAFYWVIVFLARLLERFVHFSLIERNPPVDFFPYLRTTFSWHRFSAISLWIFVLFLIYVIASEISHLFGPGELRRLFFTSRPTELQLNRRQRIRELLRLSRLMDAHSIDEFRNPTSFAHGELIEILQPLARK
jgi:hypothetical protein